ncbi:MAG: polysaccharide deacetylase family protein [Thermoleophilia bacterium]|nr:polysaccharide deacetylase family protein [Thermoleophilia bacterium]
MSTTAGKTRNRGAQRLERGPRIAAVAIAAVLLAVVAFFLVPTAHLNTRSIVQVNGVARAVPAETKVAGLAGLAGMLARPGSTLNLTGDVVSLGAGAAAERTLGGKPLDPDRVLPDGARIVVRHGDHVLESIKRVTTEIPYETSVKGEGVIVSLVQAGTPGEREVFKGVISGKQAAVFTTEAPQNAVLQRTSTASSGQKLAALTFDDGPGKFTQGVLDALAAKHVPGTFFVLGSSAAGNKAMIDKIKAAGHEVENHSWDHPVLTKLTPEQIRRQISRTSAVIGGSRYLRPPYGTYDAKVTAEAAALGIKLVLWTVDTRDWETPEVGAILANVKAQTKPGAIILMHDGGNNRSATVASVPVVIDWLFQQGYSLTTVAGLL